MKRNAIILLAAVAYLGWLIAMTNNSPALIKNNPLQAKPDQPPITETTLQNITTAESTTPTGKWAGLCSKDSIKTTDDFYQAVMADPVLANHYQNFKWSNATTHTNPAMKAKVSHRSNSLIAKTAKPIQLPEGDAVITDGVITVRAHCCNDIETLPPTSAGPPAIVTQEEPPVEFRPPTEAPPAEPYPPGLTITHFPNTDRRNFDRHTTSQTAPVPEPGTLLLFGAGLLALAHVGRKK